MNPQYAITPTVVELKAELDKQRRDLSQRTARSSSRRPQGDRVDHKRRRSPSPPGRSEAPSRKRIFLQYTNANGEPNLVCILCLSPLPHNKAKCNRATMGCGSPTRCRRDANNRIVNPDGKAICLEFNRRGCKSPNSKHLHECSGCGSKDHGAQECHLVEKA